jgi:DNA-binding NarL/FixJ family response regulator
MALPVPRLASSTVLLANLHVLLLDDDVLARGEIRHSLARAGVTRVTETGLDSTDAPRRPLPRADVIISEVNFRLGSGLSLLRALRLGRIPQLRPDTSFIFVSARVDPQVVALAAQLDAAGFIAKPVSFDRLRVALLRGQSHSCVLNPDKYLAVPLVQARHSSGTLHTGKLL